jgi:broad specificity phosphatase PhoE
MDATFFSPLTQTGLNNSIKLIDVLEKLNIDYIFSSPFIRTLQTIYPYSKRKGLKINTEHSISEIQHPHIIPVKSYQISLPQYIAEQFNCNQTYISILDPYNHNYPEDENSVKLRVKTFLTKIINEMIDSNHCIIIVTHQIVCNMILKIATQKYKDININTTFNYPRGAVTHIFDTNQFIFTPINWKYIPNQ